MKRTERKNEPNFCSQLVCLWRMVFVFLAFSPLLSALHLGLAGHNHIFNAARGEFIDLGDNFGAPSPFRHQVRRHGNIEPLDAACSVVATSCAFSNALLASSYHKFTFEPAITPRDGEQSTVFLYQSFNPHDKAIELAPKQSPPS